jgi:hypothetical protein
MSRALGVQWVSLGPSKPLCGKGSVTAGDLAYWRVSSRFRDEFRDAQDSRLCQRRGNAPHHQSPPGLRRRCRQQARSARVPGMWLARMGRMPEVVTRSAEHRTPSRQWSHPDHLVPAHAFSPSELGVAGPFNVGEIMTRPAVQAAMSGISQGCSRASAAIAC